MIRKIVDTIILICLSIFIGYYLWNNTSICSPYYFNQGKKLYNNGQYDASIKLFERSLQANPKNPSARYYYALALSKSTPTYSNQKSLYLLANSSTKDMAQNYAQAQIFTLKERLLSGVEDNYIYGAVLNKDILRWNAESFPLKVYIDSSSSPGRMYVDSIKNAFDQWTKTTNFLSFTEVDDPERSDIEIKFSDYAGPDCTSADCRYVLATTTNKTDEYHRLSKMIITFYKNNPLGEENTSTQIYNTALHEIGHALGISGHSDNPNDVMYGNNNRVNEFALLGDSINYISKRDLNTMALLYRLAPTITNSKGWYYENLYYPPLILGNEEEILKIKLEELQQYVEQYPNYCGGYINIATVYYSMGNNKMAQESLDTAESLATNDDEKYLINYNRAILFYQNQDYNSALNSALKARLIKNDDTVNSLILDINAMLN